MSKKKLSAYRIPRGSAVPSDGEEYDVRGLSLTDIMEGFEKYRSEMELLYNGLMKGDFNIDQQAEAILQAIRVAPNLIAHLIALACDEPESEPVVRQMPVADQVAFAMPILLLTLNDGLVIKKASEVVQRLQGMAGKAKS